MRCVIIGAGAVGLALGSCLHRAGHSPSFVVRGEDEPQPLAVHGLSRSGLFGDVSIGPETIEVDTSLESLRDRSPDYILVCTKTTSTAELAVGLGAMWPDLSPAPKVVLCQNGWGNAERLAERIPREHVFNARIITGFRRSQPHAVEITVHADAIHLGSLFGADHRALSPLAEAITQGGIPTETTGEIEKDVWAKVLYNCLLNPLGALTRVPYGALGEGRETRSVMQTIAQEIFAVLDRSGRKTHWSTAGEYLDVFYRSLLPPTAGHESSMLQDLRAGRATEIDALCGAVAKLGADVGVATPVNRALTLLVHAAEA